MDCCILLSSKSNKLPAAIIPMGRVYFNGTKIWSPTLNNLFYLAYLAQASSALSLNFVMPDTVQIEGYRITPMDVMSSADKAGPCSRIIHLPKPIRRHLMPLVSTVTPTSLST